MSIITPTWQNALQPPDEEMQQTCFRDWKYRYLHEGLKILRERIDELQQRAILLGVQGTFFNEELQRVEQMIRWEEENLKEIGGLIEDKLSVETLRYLKAGLLLLIIRENAKLVTSLPQRLSDAITSEIKKLEALGEERWFEKLKPADIFFDIAGDEVNNGTSTQKLMTTSSGEPIRIFYCYSSKDVRLRNKLQSHLSAMKREKIIKEWYDREIIPGDSWEDEIDANLNRADVVLLLVSADFIESDYCYTVEMEKALMRHESGECRVIPIILKSCDWKNTPFAKLEVLPTKGKEVTGRNWRSQDEAFADVASGLRKVIGSINKHKNTDVTENSQSSKLSVELDKPHATDTVPLEIGEIHATLVTHVRTGRGLMAASGLPEAFNLQQMDAIDRWQIEVEDYLRTNVGPYALLEFEKPAGNGGGMRVDELYPKRLKCSKLPEQVDILNKMAANPRQFMPPS